MKKLFALLPLFLCLSASAQQTIWWALTNWDSSPTTNATRVTQVQTTPTVEGDYAAIGLPKLYPLPTNGVAIWTNLFQPGNYKLELVGLTFQIPIYFQVGTNQGTFNAFIPGVRISGGNFFVTAGGIITNILIGTNTFIGSNAYITNLFSTFITNNILYSTNIYGPFITNNQLYSTNIFVTNLTANYITNDTSYITNIFNSNAFITNLTVQNITNINNFSGKTVITTNLFVTNSTIQYLTNNTFYTTNVLEQFVTNNTSYITNLYGPFITNNTFITTNIFDSNAFITNLTVNFITNDTSIITNLYVTNEFVTNANISFVTNNTFITTNAFISNAFITNLTVDFVTNVTQVTSNAFITNLFSSNIYTTNITLMAAIWSTNKWNGPTNNVSFLSTYQRFVASTDMEMTGLVDASCTNFNTSVVLIDPGGVNRTLYFPAAWTNFTSDGANAYPIYSTNIAYVTLFQFGCLTTNVVVRLFPFAPASGFPANKLGVLTNNGSGTMDWATSLNLTNLNLWHNSAPSPPALLVYDNSGNVGSVQSGVQVSNTAPATGSGAGVQAWSPPFVWSGNGWDSGGSVSKDIQFRAYVIPTSASGNPKAKWTLESSINNGPYANGTTLDESGDLTVSSTIKSSGANVVSASGSFIGVSSRIDLFGPANGVAKWLDDQNNNSFVAMIFGPVSNTWPTLVFSTNAAGARISTTAGFDFQTSTNYEAFNFTTSTNQNQITPDFSVPEQLMSTNAAFTFLAPVGVDTTKTTVQWTLCNVTNSSGSTIAVTPPANCHQVGTWYVTNLTAFWFQVYAQKFTNGYAVPCW